MAVTDHPRWAFAALATPVGEQPDGTLGPDIPRMAALAADLLEGGLNGIVPFGTTGEGPCFPVAQRLAAVDGLIAAGIGADAMVVAIGATALADCIALARHAAALGCPVLMPPPFFLGMAGRNGIVDAVSRLIEGAGEDGLKLLLYNIPQVSGFALPVEAVSALAEAFPDVVIGVKDSALDWDAVAALIAGRGGVDVAVGAEDFIPQAMALGGRGTICGLANLVPGAVAAAVAGDEAAGVALTRLAHAFDDRPFLPTLKAALAATRDDEAWRTPMPPVDPVTQTDSAEIVALVAKMNRG